MQSIHATAVAIENRGVLLRGPSGAGKSDLALRLIDGGAVLVADDRIELTCNSNFLMAHCPRAIGGKLEVRGVGILTLPFVSPAAVTMIVDLVQPEEIERLPNPRRVDLLGKSIRKLALAPFEPSAAAKVRSAVNATAMKSKL
tara:strand:+ start:1312 stop:1740 length:429 start_codon:yes stop_codon:yes gene_type:complete